MIPSRTSRAITEWTTPSAFLHPGYVDDELDFDLRDTHFFMAGNHFILHHLDYYILQQNSLRMLQYVQSQRDFWKFVALATDILQWKLQQYTRQLPEHTTLGIPTSEMMQRVDQILDHVMEELHDIPQQRLSVCMNPPVYVSETPSTIHPTVDSTTQLFLKHENDKKAGTILMIGRMAQG